MIRRAAAAAVVLVVLGGCGGSDGAERTDTTVEGSSTTAQPEQPGVVLQTFVRAAGSGDDKGMWERLSLPTQRRLGQTLASFRRTAAPALAQEAGALGEPTRVLLSQTITPRFAVAAIERASEVHAVALRFENGSWRVELGSPVQVEPLRPEPGETVARRTQLAAEVKAKAPLVEAGLWVDSQAFPSRGGGPTPNALTMFGETPELAPGAHSVVAFASTATNATARGWAFRARVR